MKHMSNYEVTEPTIGETPELGLALHRERYKINQHRTVEIRVGVVQPDMPGSPVEAWGHCLTCDDVLLYFEDRGIFECVECGYSMSKAEAADLCEAHIECVNRMVEGFTSLEVADDVDIEVKAKKKRWYFLWLW
jgi:Zn ribbon nucleic-acid-binding protein